jgi:hypothetical protein
VDGGSGGFPLLQCHGDRALSQVVRVGQRTSVRVPLIGTDSGGPLPRTWEDAIDQGAGDGLDPADQVRGNQLQHSPP